MQQLNRLIKMYVAENDVTINWVADQLGISRETLRSKRYGTRGLTFRDAVRIAKLLDISLEDLAERLNVA